MDSFNRWLDRFCYRRPRFGIRNLMRYIVLINVVVYLLFLVDTRGIITQFFYFAPPLILKGQIWRLVSYVFVPGQSNIFYFALMQYFYYFIGTHLEAEWGCGKFTIYYLMSVLVTALLALGTFVITKSLFLMSINATYINLSLFFAFATMFPDANVLLFFFIPVKMKWLALVDAAYQVVMIIVNARYFPLNLLPVFAVVTYLLFFASTLVRRLMELTGRRPKGPKAYKITDYRQTKKKAQPRQASTVPFLRKCSVCGRTNAEFPDLEFRYCSKCVGTHCFCIDHINNHIHYTE